MTYRRRWSAGHCRKSKWRGPITSGTLGKRLPAASFLQRRADERVGFCDATLSWDVVAEVHEGARLTDWHTGFPDLYAAPDFATFRVLPWRPGAAQVVSDVVDHAGEPIRTAPRTVLRRVTERLSELGYHAQIGVETEFFLLDAEGQPLAGAVHCYSLEKLNELGPILAHIVDGLAGYVPVEAITSEYGPGQLEINIHHKDPVNAADDAFRLKYAVRALARAAGARATFMAKPFQGLSGSSMHLHVSLWRDGAAAFVPEAGAENPLMRTAIAGLVRHLPAIAVFGAPSINSYKRFEARSYAPTTAAWGGDNRTAAVRSLVEADRSTRIELRTRGADANPYWAVAALLAAVIAGIEDRDKVVVWYTSANRDETVFSSPYRLDLRRSPNPHTTFGRGGPHRCLGEHLARLELRVLLRELLPALPRLEPDGPPARIRSNFTNGLKRFPVRLAALRVVVVAP